MVADSSGVSGGAERAATLFSSWRTLLAPTRAEVTRSSRSTQERASCARVWLREPAISLSARARSRYVSSRFFSDRNGESGRAARDPSGATRRGTGP